MKMLKYACAISLFVAFGSVAATTPTVNLTLNNAATSGLWSTNFRCCMNNGSSCSIQNCTAANMNGSLVYYNSFFTCSSSGKNYPFVVAAEPSTSASITLPSTCTSGILTVTLTDLNAKSPTFYSSATFKSGTINLNSGANNTITLFSNASSSATSQGCPVYTLNSNTSKQSMSNTWHGCSQSSSWNNCTCTCPAGTVWSTNNNTCESVAQVNCEGSGGTWSNNNCVCGGGQSWNGSTCACSAGKALHNNRCEQCLYGPKLNGNYSPESCNNSCQGKQASGTSADCGVVVSGSCYCGTWFSDLQ